MARRRFNGRLFAATAVAVGGLAAAIAAFGTAGAPAPTATERAATRVPAGDEEVHARHGAPSFKASWGNRPASVEALATGAETVIVGRVAQIREGPRAGADESQFHAGDEAGMPTQRVTFEVEDTWAGQAPSRLTLFKSGSQSKWMEEDPPYEMGQRYVLFVTKADRYERGLYMNPAPDGRMGVNGDRLVAVAHGALAEKLDGTSVADLKKAVQTEKDRG